MTTNGNGSVETVPVLFLRSGLTIGEQVHIAGTCHDMPLSHFQSEDEQIRELGSIYYRPLTAMDVHAVPSSESYLAPRSEAAQSTSVLITVTAAAAVLGCHRNTVLGLIRRGVLRAERWEPGNPQSPWRIRRSSLIRYLDDSGLGDWELETLGRPPSTRGSHDVLLDNSSGTMVGTLPGVTSADTANVVREIEEELAGEDAASGRPVPPNQVPHPLTKEEA